MRLLEWNEKEDYQPLERGNALPQYYENGDKYNCHSNAFDWHYKFWHQVFSGGQDHSEQCLNLMGGEL